MTDKIHAIQTSGAPQAIGPYSQGVRAGAWLFLSGQVPLDPETGTLVAGDMARQTERVMENLKAVLTTAGADFSQVVKTTIYLVDLADFSVVNEIYARYLTPPFPARATVGVAALPRGAGVEVEATAWLPGADQPG